jgi:DNA-binding MarR family transcriptional regulator
VESLTEVLADFLTRMKTVGEMGSIMLAAGLDLSLTQVCSLFILESSDHAPAVHELAERLGLSVAATGRAVDALAKADLVARREDEHDRRVKRVTLTPAGGKLLLRLTQAHRDGLQKFVELLDDQERENLFTVLVPILARHRQPFTAKESG